MTKTDRPTITIRTKRNFPYCWLRCVTGATLAGRACCAKVFRGPYLSVLPLRYKKAGETFAGLLDEHGGNLWYLCSVVGGMANWHLNTHLLLTPAPESRFVFEDPTIRVEVEGANPLPILPLPVTVASRLDVQRARCRNVWAAFQYFPEARQSLLDGLELDPPASLFPR